MGKKLSEITDGLKEFIKEQRIFFVATASIDSRVNLSPKGSDSLRVIDSNRVVWQNLTGSGNETASHIREVNRITIMFCAFDGKPNILRLYGTATEVQPNDEDWVKWEKLFPSHVGTRQFFDVKVDLVQTSCGFQVPFFEYVGERGLLDKWAQAKGQEGIEEYWQTKNSMSIDGKPIKIYQK